MKTFLLISFLVLGMILDDVSADEGIIITEPDEPTLTDSEEDYEIQVTDNIELVCAVVMNDQILDYLSTCLEIYEEVPSIKAVTECKPEWDTMKKGIEGICSNPSSIITLTDCMNEKIRTVDMYVPWSEQKKMNKEFTKCLKDTFNDWM